jgi:hypothetical protein
VTELVSDFEFHFNNISPFIIKPVGVFYTSHVNGIQGKGRGVKKIGGRKVIRSQSVGMVVSFYSFVKK